ncbi:MAG: winged helix-turn-helix domain-containing protein [Zestosphaera sp.]
MGVCKSRSAGMLASLVILALLVATALTPSSSFNVRYRYVLNPDGTSSILVVVSNIVDEKSVRIKLERNYLENSLMAFSSEGMPLPTTITPEGEVVLDVIGLSNVTIEYVARVGELVNDVQINTLISPLGPAEVVLPPNSALLYFNGSPRVGTRSDASGKYTYVILEFDSGGRYEVNYLALLTTETRTTTPPVTPTTKPATPATTPTVTPTTIPPSTTPATTPTVTPTTIPPSEGEGIARYVVVALLVIALLSLIVYFLLRRRITSSSVEPLIETGFDERDKAILKVLSENEASLTDLSKATKLNKSVVWRRLERLRSLGYVEKGYSRGMSIYRLTPKGLKLLKEFSE